MVFVFLNALFFGSILIGALLAQDQNSLFYVLRMDERIVEK